MSFGKPSSAGSAGSTPVLSTAPPTNPLRTHRGRGALRVSARVWAPPWSASAGCDRCWCPGSLRDSPVPPRKKGSLQLGGDRGSIARAPLDGPVRAEQRRGDRLRMPGRGACWEVRLLGARGARGTQRGAGDAAGREGDGSGGCPGWVAEPQVCAQARRRGPRDGPAPHSPRPGLGGCSCSGGAGHVYRGCDPGRSLPQEQLLIQVLKKDPE